MAMSMGRSQESSVLLYEVDDEFYKKYFIVTIGHTKFVCH